MNHVTSVLDEIMLKDAIFGDVSTSLPEILSKLTKQRLDQLGKKLKLPYYYKLKKAELVDELHAHIIQPSMMSEVLMEATQGELDQLLALRHTSSLILKQLTGDEYHGLRHGLLFKFVNQGQLVLVMPDEVKKAMARIVDASFKKKFQRRALIFDYINALTDLYGVVKPDKLVEIFNEQNSDPLTVDELLSVYKRYGGRFIDFQWYLDYFVDISIIFSKDRFDYLLKHAEGKPYYIPPKPELLRYADGDYYESTPQVKALESYLRKHVIKIEENSNVLEQYGPEEMITDLLFDIQLACSEESTLEEIIFEFERREIEFEDMEQVQTVLSLIVDVYNHTRMPLHRGHTPVEMSSLMGEEKAGKMIQPTVVPSIQPVVSKKIGRNEKCPCGSGLKYKRCCGR